MNKSSEMPAVRSVIAALVLLAACRDSDDLVMPERITLYQTEPVIAATFLATGAGYSMQAFRATAAPTLDFLRDRAVQIVAKDNAGAIVARVSVPNPREIRSLDRTNHLFASAPQGTFTVFLPKPDAIRSLDLVVVRGPNTGLKKSFTIEPLKLSQFGQRPPKTNQIINRLPLKTGIK